MKKLLLFAKVVGRYIRHFGSILVVLLLLALATELLAQTQPLSTGWLWRVIISMVPGVIVLGLVWVLVGNFLRRVYNLGSIGPGIGLLARRRFGKFTFAPYMLLSQGKVLADPRGVAAVGGPASLVIHNDTAVILEKAGRLTRVEGHGFPVLEPFEKVYDIIDLRPKTWNYTVNALTKEGIPLSWDMEVQYQINDGGVAPTDKEPYPFVKADVFRAAVSKWRREKTRTQDLDWEGRVVVGQTEGILRSILGQRRLDELIDELIGLSEADRLVVREAIQRDLEEILRQAAPQLGAKILGIKLNKFKVDDEITNQWIENWRVRWQTTSNNQLADEEAEDIKEAEKHKTEAQIIPFKLLTEALQELQSGQDLNAIISMRLIAALALARTEGREVFAPNEAMDTLKKFQELLEGSADKSDDKPSQLAASSSPEPPDRTLPLLGEVAAGQAIPVNDDIIGQVQQTGETEFALNGQPLKVKRFFKGNHLNFDPECNYVVLSVTGDSMNRAGIDHGDYVILQTKVQPMSGDVVAVSFHGRDDRDKATIKRIHIEGSQVVLQPESSNPTHEPRVLSKSAFAGDNPQAQVVGIVMAVLG